MSTLNAKEIIIQAVVGELSRDWDAWKGSPWYNNISNRHGSCEVIGTQVWESLRTRCSQARSAYLDEQESNLRGTTGDTPMHFAWGLFVCKPDHDFMVALGYSVERALWGHFTS